MCVHTGFGNGRADPRASTRTAAHILNHSPTHATLASATSGILSAYSDNASVIEGHPAVRLIVDPTSKEYVPVCVCVCLCIRGQFSQRLPIIVGDRVVALLSMQCENIPHREDQNPQPPSSHKHLHPCPHRCVHPHACTRTHIHTYTHRRPHTAGGDGAHSDEG